MRAKPSGCGSLLFAATLALAGQTLAFAGPALAFAGATPAVDQGYVLRYGDVVRVTVLGQADLSAPGQPIRPDGRISLPLAGDVNLSGKTVAKATADVTQAYAAYFSSPRVAIVVEKFRPLHITLLGQVMRPGVVQFDEAPALLDALASAGGLSERAERRAIKVVGSGGDAHVYDFNRIVAGKIPAPTLEDGSVVEVQEVLMPDFYRLVPLVASVVGLAVILFR